MLVHQGSGRTEAFDRRLAVSLATIAGALNAAAFHAVGFFSANMTGNVSIFSDRVASGHLLPAFGFFAIVIAFISGATVSSLLINAGRRRKIPGIFAYSILAEAVLLAPLGLADIWLREAWRVPLIVMALSFLMGLQNAVVTRISNARVRTTHVSGMATDIGIELGNLLDVARGREAFDQASNDRSKLLLHVQTVIAFLLGGVAGVIGYAFIAGGLFLLASAVLFSIALSGIFAARGD
ncbi:YoaK family protein [Bradyrhizobium sp. SYSU BS000235]|uniref:YoaK family protein n=1 Tax=Bradyrhizobium sp. SYSU BS000235 TaxID=3411332 RepID=UPI003C77B048